MRQPSSGDREADVLTELGRLGECHLTAGETEPAARLHQALEIFQCLGLAPDTQRVRTRLASIPRRPRALGTALLE